MKPAPMLLSVLALAGCGGGAAAPTQTACPLGILNTIAVIAPPPVLYPNANFNGLTNGGFNIVLAYRYGSTLELSGGSNSSPVYTQQVVVPAPTPLPGGATPAPNATPAAYFVPASSLASGTTYTITGFVNIGCGPLQPNTLGTFSTEPAP